MGHEFWFRPKTFGYGATPITWEGWAVVAVYGLVVAMYLRKGSFPTYLASMATIVVATIALVVVSVQKTDGAWGWNAGAKQIAGKSD